MSFCDTSVSILSGAALGPRPRNGASAPSGRAGRAEDHIEE